MSETTAALPGTPTQAELEQIRRYTRRDFAPEELYVFPAVLCDNQIDRDGERFSRDCLRELAELFVGVTGVFDHRASAEGQHARIFAAGWWRTPAVPPTAANPIRRCVPRSTCPAMKRLPGSLLRSTLASRKR